MTDKDRIAAGLRYLEQQKRADPLKSFRSLEGLKDAYERRVQPIINNAMQTFETGGAVGDLLRAYGSAAAPANAAVLEGMGMPYRGPMTAPRQEGVSSGENFRAMGDPRQQAVGQIIGDPANLAQPVGARLANALKFAKPDAMKMVQEMSRGAISPMDVWHGSPHRFAPTAKNPLGEFDPTKIGTGEGAQAYGYGHYTAESPKVATDYRNALSGNHNLDQFQFTVNGNPTDSAVAKAIVRAGSPEAFIKGMQPKLGSLTEKAAKASKEELIPGLSDYDIAMLELKSHKAMMDEASGYIGKTVKREPLGSLYKIDLPDEVVPRMLDWDKPLSQQSESVKKALSVDKRAKDSLYQDVGEYYRALTSRYAANAPAHMSVEQAENWAQQFASQKLREMGIPGIQYLDAGSRGASTGTRNFVVFPGNEGLLNILGRE